MPSEDASTFDNASGRDVASDEGIPEVGSVIDGKYRVEARIGIGGMGAVLRAIHLTLGERYAIKCLLPNRANDPDMIARFLREARASARLKSEYIPQIADVGQLPGGSPYIVMEHLVGADLANVLEAGGALPIGEAVEYVLQACAGVAEAHALGIIHRDLKPANLFLTERSDGTALVKVLDFGIAKALDEERPSSGGVTETTNAFGSPAYMSPEQLRSAKHVDFRTDVWGLGVILYELIAGRRPFHAETPLAMLAAIAADEPHPLREARPEVSPDLEGIIARCLEKSVDLRYGSVAELLADALTPFATGSVVSLGRIKRLARAPHREATAPDVAALPPRAAEPASAATDKSWTTTATVAPGGRTRWLVLGALVIILAGGAIGYVARGAPRSAAASGSALLPAEAAPLPSPPPSSPAMEASVASPPALASSLRATSVRPPSAAPPRLARPKSVVAPASAPSPQVPVDPFANSH